APAVARLRGSDRTDSEVVRPQGSAQCGWHANGGRGGARGGARGAGSLLRRRRGVILVGLTAVIDSGHEDCARHVEVEEHTPLADAQPEVMRPALQLLHVSVPG